MADKFLLMSSCQARKGVNLYYYNIPYYFFKCHDFVCLPWHHACFGMGSYSERPGHQPAELLCSSSQVSLVPTAVALHRHKCPPHTSVPSSHPHLHLRYAILSIFCCPSIKLYLKLKDAAALQLLLSPVHSSSWKAEGWS